MKTQNLKDFALKPVKPSTYRDLAVVLEQFPAGIYYLILLSAGLATTFGLASSIVAAPLAFPVLVGTFYIARKSVNAEYGILGSEAERHGVDFDRLVDVGGADFFDLSRKILSDASSWKTVLVSLIRFPVGVAAFTYVVFYYSLSASLMTAPLLYKSQGYISIGSSSAVTTMAEAVLVSVAGIAVFVVGANVLGLLSKAFLELMRFAGSE